MSRSKVFTHFSAFYAEIKTQFNASMCILKSDNAEVYMSIWFGPTWDNSILHQSPCVDTPSRNGVVERKNRHLLQTACAFLFQMKVPKQFRPIRSQWLVFELITCHLLYMVVIWLIMFFPNKSIFLVEPKVYGSTCSV